MPRNITVTLADGTQHVYANAPDNLTPDQVSARAQSDFGQSVTALDGGRGSPPATATATPAVRQRQFGKFSASAQPQALAALKVAESSFQNSMQAKGVQGPALDAAMARFRSDPRYQALAARAQNQDAPTLTNVGRARLAGQPAPPPTQADRIQASAQANSQQHVGATGNFLTALKAGVTRGAFGIPERIAAAGEAYLPSAITGNHSNANYSQILDQIRANTNADLSQSTPGNIAGQVIGGFAGGRAAAGALGAVASKAQTVGIPLVANAGNYLQSLLTLNKGARVANAAKVVAAGGAQGGAQAVGEGTDPITGIGYGMAGAAVLGTGFKAAQVLTRPFRDFLQLSSAGQILSRLTSATTEQLSQRAAAYRQATGAEPTLFELLPLADRNKVLKQAVVGRDNVVESASDAIRARAANLGPEMSDRARAILAPQRNAITAGMRDDLATARGGTPDNGDAALAANASNSPTDMLALRDQEARAIMAPHDATPAADSFGDILPQTPVQGTGANAGTITMTDADPAVTAAIRSVAPAGFRVADQGVTAGDISDMIQKLRGDLSQGGIEGRTAQRAIDHLEGELGARAPDAAAAHAQMTEAYAARSRMAEGMKEGAATRLRDDIQVGTSRGQARTVRNAYDSAEGATGRTLGQGNRVLSDLGGSPEEALRATVGISRNSTGRQLAQNVGPDAAAQIGAAARAQDESARALAGASSMAQSGGGEAANAETLVQALAGLHPSSFVTTKASAVRKLLDMTYIPNSRARTMVDMIFSQNPDMVRRALNAVGNAPNGAKFLQYLGGLAGSQTEQNVGALDNAQPDPNAPAEPPPGLDAPAPQDDPNAPANDASAAPAAGAPVAEADSPYAPNLQQIYDTESPEMLDLIRRVGGQESGGGNQFDANGKPLTSSAGAIGAMQVMPDTAPEAARLAGVPFDDNAYRNDPAYNKLIGIAYLSQLLRRYDGDVAKAVAAYNAGPGRVEAALKKGGDWTQHLPAETQDYVRKVA